MTDKERQEFIDKVKGKKIKWHSWEKKYFVPDGNFLGNSFCGVTYHKDGSVDSREWFMNEGFGDYVRGSCWEFVDATDCVEVTEVPMTQIEGGIPFIDMSFELDRDGNMRKIINTKPGECGCGHLVTTGSLGDVNQHPKYCPYRKQMESR